MCEQWRHCEWEYTPGGEDAHSVGSFVGQGDYGNGDGSGGESGSLPPPSEHKESDEVFGFFTMSPVKKNGKSVFEYNYSPDVETHINPLLWPGTSSSYLGDKDQSSTPLNAPIDKGGIQSMFEISNKLRLPFRFSFAPEYNPTGSNWNTGTHEILNLLGVDVPDWAPALPGWGWRD